MLFGERNIDEQMVKVITLNKDYEAAQAKEILDNNGIKSRIVDRGGGDFLRISGWGSPFGVDVFVHKDFETEAKKILEAFEPIQEGLISDEELEQEALNAREQPVEKHHLFSRKK